MRREGVVKLTAVLVGIAVLFDAGCVNHQAARAVLVTDYTPDEPLPARLEFADDSTAEICGPDWHESWFKAALTLARAGR